MAAGFVDYLRGFMGWWSSPPPESEQPAGSGFAVQAGITGAWQLQAGGMDVVVMTGGGVPAAQVGRLLSVVQAGRSGAISVQWPE